MLCAILVVTNTAKSQWPFQAGGTLPPPDGYFPSNYFVLQAAGVGRSLQPFASPLGIYFTPATYPKLLVHSSNDYTNNNRSTGILRIQDVNYNESTPNMLGEPQ